MQLKYPAILLICLISSGTLATTFISTNQYHVLKDTTVTDEQWIAANSVTAAGTFENDLFLISGTEQQLSGSYHGNVWCSAPADVILNGTCKRNVRLVGQNIRINGTIEGNLMALAYNSIIIGTNAQIKGNVKLWGVNSIIQEGTINDRADITSATRITLDGLIGGNAVITAPEIILSDSACVEGNLSYQTGKELLPDEGVVAGELKRTWPERPSLLSRFQSQTIWFLAALLTGIPFISLFPMTTAMASLIARKSPLKCLLVGFVAVGALPIFGVMAISSGIGLPLGAIIIASWGILSYLSRIIMALLVGTLILRSGSTSAGRVLLAMATGLVLFYAVTLVPSMLGLLAKFVVVWMGMGSLLLALLQKRRLIIQVPEELRQIEALKNEHKQPSEESP